MRAPVRAEIVVDLGAIRDNVRLLKQTAGVTMITVVKGNAYGHGLVPVARAAREGGADWLAVATLDEVRALRDAGDTGRLLTWLTVPGEDFDDLILAGVDLTAYSVAELDEIREAVRFARTPARVQLKVDTGLNRGGAARRDWERFFAHARAGEEAGDWSITGLWSHLSAADEPDHPQNAQQEQRFRDAIALAHDAGLRPELCHLANSAGAVLHPSMRFDAVRCGIATYGLDPAPGVDHGLPLRPAMTVRARLAMVKHLEAGDAVSYGGAWVAPAPTTVGVVPVGYAEGLPRAASDRAEVLVAGRRRPVRGRICMDQLVVDLGGDEPPVGSEVLVFGPPEGGAPTAQDWAEAAGTINYEIVTRIGGRMRRRYVDQPLDGSVPGARA